MFMRKTAKFARVNQMRSLRTSAWAALSPRWKKNS